jgi:hypothetical protein
MFMVEGFQKFPDIPLGISGFFKIPGPQQLGANRRTNRSITVLINRPFPD